MENSNKPSVVLIGKTGSGKSAQGQSIAAQYGVPFISSGSIARDMARHNADTKVALNTGLLAPEEEMRIAIRAAVEGAIITTGGFVLDGFPRTVAQLICLLQWTSDEPMFFLLDIADLDVITRLLTRERKDDNPDAIARKLQSFREETQALVDLLEDGNALWRVEAARPKEQIQKRIAARIDRDQQRTITKP